MMGSHALEVEFSLLRQWLFEQALPLWSTAAVDRRSGGFFEWLTEDGAPVEEPRRARVTGRQIYSFAIAEQLGWDGPTRDLVRHGLVSLESFIGTNGFVVPLKTVDGTVLRHDFDLYDHAFVLFGLAAAVGTGEQCARLEALAEQLRGRIQAHFAHPVAGFQEGPRGSVVLKANPHMHMLEAALAWETISDDPAWGALADEIAELCLEKFIDPETGALREFFDHDWNRIEEAPGDLVEPGHQFEWAWLLKRWGLSRNRPDAFRVADRLIAVGEQYGICRERGLAYNELNGDLSIRIGTSRLWPQTERIKAHVISYATAVSEQAAEASARLAVEAIRALRRYFEYPLRGGWHEYIDVEGRPIRNNTRTSSLYHIICAISEVADLIDTGNARRQHRQVARVASF
ncbi:AGE family epimerase/isomerase [Zavarzinia compransoris]|nr:AGE family epimerase/isomerase [Zavarzinia compransoris]